MKNLSLFLPSRRFVVLVWLIGSLLALPKTLLAAETLMVSLDAFETNAGDTYCGINDILKGYAKGLRAYQQKDYSKARTHWAPLADRGFQPAARWRAVIYANGKDMKQDLMEAAFWAKVAAHGMDVQGRKISLVLRGKLTPAEQKTVDERFKAWSPNVAQCWGDSGADQRTDNYSFISRFGIKVLIDPRLKKEAADLVYSRFTNIIDLARRSIPMAELYLLAVEQAEIHVGDRYDRFLRFKPGVKGNVLQISIGNFLDKEPQFVAQAIAYEALRHVYSRLGKSKFTDPYTVTYKGKRFVGSIYPDADNKEFFKIMKQVTDMAAKLPEKYRRAFDVVDEIRYTPHSKYFEMAGVLDGGVAYYNRQWSMPDRRMIFLRRDLRYSSSVDMLMNVVHEGTHVLQDIRSEDYEAQIPELRIALQDLEKVGEIDTPNAKDKKKELARMEDYVLRWRRGITPDKKFTQDINFECEATMMEINVAKAVDAPPRLVENSQYLALCEDAKIAIVRWKDSLISNRKR